jgi:hypothetical protein
VLCWIIPGSRARHGYGYDVQDRLAELLVKRVAANRNTSCMSHSDSTAQVEHGCHHIFFTKKNNIELKKEEEQYQLVFPVGNNSIFSFILI